MSVKEVKHCPFCGDELEPLESGTAEVCPKCGSFKDKDPLAS